MLFDKVYSSIFGKSLNIEPLLLRIEKSQLGWFGQIKRMLPEKLLKQAQFTYQCKTKKISSTKPERIDHLKLNPGEMIAMMEDRQLQRLNLELLLSSLYGKGSNEKEKREKFVRCDPSHPQTS